MNRRAGGVSPLRQPADGNYIRPDIDCDWGERPIYVRNLRLGNPRLAVCRINLSRVDAVTGEDQPGAIRLAGIGNIYASPVAAAGRVYVTDLDGATAVVSHGDVPLLLSINRLKEPVAASAAIAGRDLFLRGEKSLYRLTEPDK